MDKERFQIGMMHVDFSNWDKKMKKSSMQLLTKYFE